MTEIYRGEDVYKRQLLDDFFVVASEPVDAFDEQQIPFLQFFQQFEIRRAFKILARLFVHEDVLFFQSFLCHCDALPFFILVGAADTHISVNLSLIHI